MGVGGGSGGEGVRPASNGTRGAWDGGLGSAGPRGSGRPVGTGSGRGAPCGPPARGSVPVAVLTEDRPVPGPGPHRTTSGAMLNRRSSLPRRTSNSSGDSVSTASCSSLESPRGRPLTLTMMSPSWMPPLRGKRHVRGQGASRGLLTPAGTGGCRPSGSRGEGRAGARLTHQGPAAVLPRGRRAAGRAPGGDPVPQSLGSPPASCGDGGSGEPAPTLSGFLRCWQGGEAGPAGLARPLHWAPVTFPPPGGRAGGRGSAQASGL